MSNRLEQTAAERAQVREEMREDELMIEAMAPLRTLEPTGELRLKNRRRLAAALEEQESRRLAPRLSLWRRRIALPLPLAIALALLAMAGAALVVAWSLDWWTPFVKPLPPPLAKAAAMAPAPPFARLTA